MCCTNLGGLFYDLQVFDMKEYRSHVILHLHRTGLRRLDLETLRRLSVISLSLVRTSQDDRKTPCWLNIINLEALRMLNNQAGLSDFSIHHAVAAIPLASSRQFH